MSKPFVKWAGGKRQLLPVIENNLPEGLGDSITRYCEPFIGGGALLFHLLEKHKFSEVYISDLNTGLITVYYQIRDNLEALIVELRRLSDEYYALPDLDAKAEYYYAHRKTYNLLAMDGAVFGEHEKIVLASLFIFINKTNFNGVYRVNRKGEFNIAFGKNNTPAILDEENLRAVSKDLQTVHIHHGRYQDSESWIDENTFVYLDPPYRPLNLSANFNKYVSSGFNDDDQTELSEWVQRQSARGAKLMLSNSDPKNSNPDDDFFDDLYAWANIQRVSARRNVSPDATTRGKMNEILVTTY